jgi:branched-subunit amino acid transport protein
MTTEFVLLALLMGAATYPSRALPILAPGIERLPAPVLEYLRLVGPAVLAAIGAVNVLVVKPDGGIGFHVGIEAVAVVACLALTLWRRNLLLGLIAAVVIVAVARAVAGGV